MVALTAHLSPTIFNPAEHGTPRGDIPMTTRKTFLASLLAALQQRLATPAAAAAP